VLARESTRARAFLLFTTQPASMFPCPEMGWSAARSFWRLTLQMISARQRAPIPGMLLLNSGKDQTGGHAECGLLT